MDLLAYCWYCGNNGSIVIISCAVADQEAALLYIWGWQPVTVCLC